MDDIEAIIATVKAMHFEDGITKPFLNPISSLPSSKRKLKESIKERIRLLHGAYISLATFIPDEDWETICVIEKHLTKKQKMIVRRVLKELERNGKEIKGFRVS